MATAALKRGSKRDAVKEYIFLWEGKDRSGKQVKGEMRASGENVVNATLRRQGILVTKVRKQRVGGRKKITEKDITLFTRQLATMMKAGVPLLQAFDIVGKGHSNPSVSKLLLDIRTEVETGSSLAAAFRKFPLYFDALFCNLVQAGEQAGILESLLDRLATYKEKILAIKSKIKSALFYPTAVIVVAFVITAVIMIWVIPAFKEIFNNFGADLPAPTLMVISMSDFFVEYWYAIFGGLIGGIWGFFALWKRSRALQIALDRWFLKLPVFGDIIRKAVIARWTRTLATMFAAGVPLVDALESVAGATGNSVYETAVLQMREQVSSGQQLQVSMKLTNLFPNMMVQMVAIGEESGSLDSMLAKVADFYEEEVDNAVDSLSSLLEPLIMAILGILVGGLVVAMYLPIFQLGSVV